MEKEKIENKFLDLIKKYELIDSDRIKKISHLKILGKVNQITEIQYKYFNQDTEEYDACIIQLKTQENVLFNKELLDILFELEAIGNQSHIQELEIILSTDSLPIVKLQEFIHAIHPTIFEESQFIKIKIPSEVN